MPGNSGEDGFLQHGWCLVMNRGTCIFFRFVCNWFETWYRNVQYFAAKILTVHATRGHQRKELDYLRAIRDLGIDRSYLPILLDYFEEQGPHGIHLCLVMNVLGTDVSSFRRSAPEKRLRPYMAKIIVALITESLVSLHDLNIIHAGVYPALAWSTDPYIFTDLKLDNVLFGPGHDNPGIDALLLDEPPAVDGEFELYGKRYPIMRSQPLRHKFPWDASRHLTELLSVYLTDFSHGPFSLFFCELLPRFILLFISNQSRYVTPSSGNQPVCSSCSRGCFRSKVWHKGWHLGSRLYCESNQ